MEISLRDLAARYRLLTTRPDRTGCPPADELVAAALGESGRRARRRLAAHVRACSDCAEELRAVAAAAPLDAAPERILRRWLPLVASGALAALLLTWNLFLWRGRLGPPEPAVNVPIFDLDPGGMTRGAEATERNFEVASDVELVTLILNLGEEPAHAGYALELADSGDVLVWQGTGLERSPYDTFTVVLPRAMLAPGRYRLRLFGLDGHRRVLLEEYAFRLELSPSG